MISLLEDEKLKKLLVFALALGLMLSAPMALSATEAEDTVPEAVENETEEVETPLDTTLPNAEVKSLGVTTVGAGEGIFAVEDYYIYDLLGNQDQKLATGTKPFKLQVTMEFVAKDTPEQAAGNMYGEYTTDFFIQINGIENGSFVGNECYLAGYYPSYGDWVLIPLDGFTVEDGKVYPVITSAGFDFSYVDICDSVEQFICGIYLSDEVLAANPNLNVTLSLGLSESKEAALSAEFTLVDEYTYDVEDLTEDVADETVAMIGDVCYASVEEALDAAQAGDTVVLVADATSGTLIVYSGVTLDLAGYTLEAGHIAAFAGSDVIDSSEANSALLKADKDCVILAKDNSQMPVWNEDGYMFATMKMQAQMAGTSTATTFRFQYRPRFSSNVMFGDVKGLDNYLFADGTEDNGVSVSLRLAWDDSNNNVKGAQEFTYTSEYTSQIYGESSGALVFTLGNAAKFENLQVFACISSELGVVAEVEISLAK